MNRPTFIPQVSYRFLTVGNVQLVLSRGRFFYGGGEGWFPKSVKSILIYIQLKFIVSTQSNTRPCA